MTVVEIVSLLAGVGGLLTAAATLHKQSVDEKRAARRDELDALRAILYEVQEENGRLSTKLAQAEARLAQVEKENYEAGQRERVLASRVDELIFILRQAGIQLPEWARNG